MATGGGAPAVVMLEVTSAVVNSETSWETAADVDCTGYA